MNKEEILNTFLLANIPEIITQEEFNDIKKAIKQLLQENKKYKEVIDKVRKLIEKHYYKESDDYYDYFTEGVCLQDGDYNELEDILKEVE